MTYTITATTDNKFLGHEIELPKSGLVTLPDDSNIQIESIMHTDAGLRLITSNYIIDVKG